MMIECFKKISFLSGTSCLLKFILKTIWIAFIAACVYFVMMRYTLPIIVKEFGDEYYFKFQKKLEKKVDSLSGESLSKSINKKIKNIEKKLFNRENSYERK